MNSEQISFSEPASVLLLGSQNILALSVIRSVGLALPETEIHTLSLEGNSRSISEMSKYVDSRHYLCPKGDLYGSLERVIKETGADILLPIDEEYVREVSFQKHRLKKLVHLPPLPSPHMLDTLIHKDKLCRLLEWHQFPHAITYRTGKSGAVPAADIFPCMLKPIRGSSGSGVCKINDRDQLQGKIAELESDDYIVQEYIPGEDIGCNLLSVDGQLKAFTVQKFLDGEEFGVATAVEFVENDTISDYVDRLLKLTGFSGWANLDFRLDSRDGQMKLIDFNARFWFSLMGSRAAGVDFIRIICGIAMGAEVDPPVSRKITYYMGRNTFRYYWKRIAGRSKNNESSIYTDLWERIDDPLPEVARYLKRDNI